MEIDWNEVILTEEILNNVSFKQNVRKTLCEIFPWGKNWTRYYDTWHRHLIPISSFLLSIDDAVKTYGLPYFSPSEDPVTVLKIRKEVIKEYKDIKNVLETKLDILDIDSLNYQDVLNAINCIYVPYYIDNVEGSLWDIKRDLDDRNQLITDAKNKYDIRWYILLHHCWNNATTIYIVVSFIYPTMKWNIITSDSHALVTTGRISQLYDYLYNDSMINKFYIADPTIKGKYGIKALMPNPNTWKII